MKHPALQAQEANARCLLHNSCASSLNVIDPLCLDYMVRGAKSYLHEYTTDDTLQPQNWQSSISTGSKLVVGNLQPGTRYYCRVGAVGGNDQLVYSDLVSRIAQ
jgi:hypothetical protein